MDQTTEAKGKMPEHPGGEELARLLQRAEQGDRSVLPALRKALDANSAIWREYGDLARHAEVSLVNLAAGPNLLLAESLSRRLAELKRELAGPSPGPLERLLAERVAACWLQVAYLDAVCAQARGVRPSEVDHARRHQDAAHRRLLAAVKTTAVVRKLVRPAPAPVEIATRLNGGPKAGTTRRSTPHPAEGAGVVN